MSTITADDGTGNVQTFQLADFLVLFPNAIVKTPTANFSFPWNGVLTGYLINQPVIVTADQFAAMTAAGCPIS